MYGQCQRCNDTNLPRSVGGQMEGATAMFTDRYSDAEKIWNARQHSAGCAFGLALLQVRGCLSFWWASHTGASL
jgi:hypothetical protein